MRRRTRDSFQNLFDRVLWILLGMFAWAGFVAIYSACGLADVIIVILSTISLAVLVFIFLKIAKAKDIKIGRNIRSIWSTLLFGMFAWAGICAIYQACGLADITSAVLSIITLAVLVFAYLAISKASDNKRKREYEKHWEELQKRYNDPDFGTTRQEREARDSFLHAGRELEKTKRDLERLEMQKSHMTEQEYTSNKFLLEATLYEWQDEVERCRKRYNEEAYKS